MGNEKGFIKKNSKSKYRLFSIFLIIFILNIQTFKISSLSIYPFYHVTKNQILRKSEALRLSNNDNIGSFHPEIAVDSSGNIHVVWYDKSLSNDEIFYRKFTHLNKSWSNIETISNITDSRNSIYPVIKIDDNDFIHVLWRESGFFTNSTLNHRFYNGEKWSDIKTVSEIVDVTLAHDFVSFSNILFILWNNKSSVGPYELFFKLYFFDNSSWSTTVQLTNSSFASIAPKVTIDTEQKIHMVWSDRSPITNDSEIYYSCLNNSWIIPKPQIISKIDFIRSTHPSITVSDKDIVHIVWEDSEDLISEIHYRAIDSVGLGEEKLISGLNKIGLYPTICSDSSEKAHIVWNENEKLKYLQLTSNGIISDSINLTETESILIFPKIAIFNGFLHIVWNDYQRDNSWEVYYLKGSFMTEQRLFYSVFIPIVFVLFVVQITIVIIKKRRNK